MRGRKCALTDCNLFDQLGHRGIKLDDRVVTRFIFQSNNGFIIHYIGREAFGWAFDPSVTQLVEEIPVKLHLTGKFRLTV
jgi:hypothetical protein